MLLQEETQSLQSSCSKTPLTIESRVLVRRAISSDLKRLVEIENHSAPEDVTWGAREFYTRMEGHTDSHLFVAETKEDGVLGYISFTAFPKSFCVVSIVVHPNFRRRKVGNILMSSLTRLGGPQSNLVVFVRESNLPYQLFLREIGFFCTKTEEEYFSSPDEDGLKFLFSFNPVAV